MVTAQDIVNSAYKLKGAPYRIWHAGDPIPMWMADNAGNPPPSRHILNVGVECSDLVNFVLQDNGLPPGGGTEAFGDYLVNTSGFDPSTPGQPGAIAFKPYVGPALGDQGHIAIYVDEHTLIQALIFQSGPGPGVTDAYTDQETYSWGGDTAFTVYGFLPNVDYSGRVAASQEQADSSGGGPIVPQTTNWFGVGADNVVRMGGDWAKGWIGMDKDGNLRYVAEHPKG